MLEYVIFSIDNPYDLHTMAKFLRDMDTKRAIGRLSDFTQGVGCYQGSLEPCFMMLAKDFHMAESYCTAQECVLRVPGDTRQPARLTSLSGQHIESLGVLRPVGESFAKLQEGWTYINGRYWVA